MATNTIIDKVATLNLILFRDNPFRRVFPFPDSFILPATVDWKLYYSEDEALLPDTQQPQIHFEGRNLILEIDEPWKLPESCFHLIKFDDVVKWAGSVTITRQTVSLRVAGTSEGVVIIYTDEGVPVEVPSSGDIVTLGFRDQTLQARDETIDAKDATQVLHDDTETIAELVAQKQVEINNALAAYVLATYLEQNFSTTTQVGTLITNAIDALKAGSLETIASLKSQIDTLTNNKVDQVSGKGLSTNDFTNALLTKLNGISVGATANSTDAQLRDRSTHTGTQLAATISDFATAVLAAQEGGTLKFNTYALAVAGLAGRTKPARVLVVADEENNDGDFGKYDYDGTQLIEDVI